MAPIAIQEALDGKTVDRMEHVTDAEYGAGSNDRWGRAGMKAPMMYGPRDVRVEERPDPDLDQAAGSIRSAPEHHARIALQARELRALHR
jgi:hypothetical protein